MKHKSYMTISEFAKITGIKRANLIFYDNAGLLSPECRGKNEYRYYTRQQLGSAYLITALRELGLGLDEIRQYAEVRTPEKMLLLLAEQKERIKREINHLYRMDDMMSLYTEMAEESLLCDVNNVQVKNMKKEPIFIGPQVNPLQTDDETSTMFYQFAAEKGIELGYPLGSIIAKKQLENGELQQKVINPVSQYYFKVKQGQNAYKPEGLYAIAYGYCGYGKSNFVYDRLLQYITEHNLLLNGDAYEEYPLNEMAIPDDSRYFVKIAIPVMNPKKQFAK